METSLHPASPTAGSSEQDLAHTSGLSTLEEKTNDLNVIVVIIPVYFLLEVPLSVPVPGSCNRELGHLQAAQLNLNWACYTLSAENLMSGLKLMEVIDFGGSETV